MKGDMLVVKIDVNDKGEGVLKSNYFDIIREMISCENPKYKHASPYAKRYISMKHYVIKSDGTFPIGLLNEIFTASKKIDPSIDNKRFIVSTRAKYFYEPSFLIPENYTLYNFEKMDYRDVQENALHRIFKRGRGVIDVGTAGGKGLIIASVIKTLRKYNPTQTFAIIVPTHLVGKTIDEFVEDYEFERDIEITAWSGKSKPNFSAPVIIVGQHIAVSRKEEFTKHIATRSVCIIDECHIIKYDGKITDRIKTMQTNNIIGFTGSVPKKEHNRLSVVGYIGKVIYKVTSRSLKEKGFKADSKVIAIRLDIGKFKNPESDNLKAYNAEKKYCLTHEKRNKFIYKWVIEMCKGNTLIPIDLDYHEELLVETFKDCGRKVVVINGRTENEERTKIYKDLENEKDTIVIVKVGVMREGISIKNLSYMVGYYIGTSFERIVQLIGRIERLGGNKIPLFYDFYDNLPFSSAHFHKRMEIYKNEDLNVKRHEVKIPD